MRDLQGSIPTSHQDGRQENLDDVNLEAQQTLYHDLEHQPPTILNEQLTPTTIIRQMPARNLNNRQDPAQDRPRAHVRYKNLGHLSIPIPRINRVQRR